MASTSPLAQDLNTSLTSIDAAIWSNLLQQILDKQSLSCEQAAQLMQGWLIEEIPLVLSGAILAALQAKGISADELAGMAQVLQSQSSSLSTPHSPLPTPLIDTCGTGGINL
jgi:anthranilate phosphoribosyltransferase